jgi:predicted nucleotidyltransferase
MDRRIDEKRGQIAAICREYRVRRLALFGSAVRDNFDASRSGLDFIVEFETLPAGTYADTYFGLIEALQGLFQRRVDLVEADSIRNPYFQQEIESQQVPVYGA